MIPIGDESPRKSTPVVTYTLVGVNVFVFALTAWGGRGDIEGVAAKWGFVPADFRFVTLITSIFLHADIFHLAGNMLYLWIFGDNVEDVLGRAKYVAFYLGMGIAAALGHYAASPDSAKPLVGASGAISGVLGAYVLLFPRNRIRVLWMNVFYPKVFQVRAVWVLGFYFVLQVIYAVAFGPEAVVAYWAHVTGFACGLAATGAGLLVGAIGRPEWAQPALVEGKVERTPNGARTEDLTVVSRRGDSGFSVERQVERRAARPLEAGEMAAFVEGSGEEKEGQGAGGRESLLKIDCYWFPKEPAARVESIIKAISAKDMAKAIAGVQLTLRLARVRGGDLSDLVSIADAFYQAKAYPFAFELYREFIARAKLEDARLPEVKFRAGMTAGRFLRLYVAALPLLEDAARTHDREDRVKMAQREIEAIRANLNRTAAEADGALLSGPCTIIRQESGPVDVSTVGKLVSRTAGKALADVTQMLRSSVGIVATEVEPMVAVKLANALQEIDVPVLVVPTDKLVALPPARSVNWVGVSAAGMEFRTGGADSQVVSKGWDEVFYVSGGRISFEETRFTGPGDDSWGGSPVSPSAFSPGVTAHQWGAVGGWMRESRKNEEKALVDVFTLDPYECYRLTDGDTSFSRAGQSRPHRSLNRFMWDFFAFASAVSTNDGAWLHALEVPSQRWRGLSFDSAADFDRYNYWRLQLEQYG